MATRLTEDTSIGEAEDEGRQKDAPYLVVVGVDIGMTCTGVAICSLRQAKKPDEPIKPTPIQRWPGRVTIENKDPTITDRAPTTANKAPTSVTYRAADLRPHSWGFGCPPPWGPRDGLVVKDWFKFLLDEKCLNEVNEGKPEHEQDTIENVEHWFKGFLSALHSYVVAYLGAGDWRVDWGSTRVEYIFGLPTAWENTKVGGMFEKLVRQAGFGEEPEGKCSVSIGLTEGIASAVWTARSIGHTFNKGDNLIVCDAGGGTTDICALQVVDIDNKSFEMKSVDQPRAIFAGSTQIDKAFERLCGDKVEALLEVLRRDRPELEISIIPEHAAKVITRGDFQATKALHGEKFALPITDFPVLGLSEKPEAKTVSDLKAESDVKIESDVTVQFSEQEIGALFDRQVSQIIDAINNQLDLLEQRQQPLVVTCLVLSGGLGSSKYVQSEIERRYRAQGMNVLFDTNREEPPLAVYKGLVVDRMQRLIHGTSIFRYRRCQASYGIITYKKSKREGRVTRKKSAYNAKFVDEHVDWFIYKNEVIHEGEPIKRKIKRQFDYENKDATWTDVIVKSKQAANCLPEGSGSVSYEPVYKIVSSSRPGSSARHAPGSTVRRKYLLWGPLCVEYELSFYIEDDSLRIETSASGEETGGQALQLPLLYTEDSE